MIMWSYLELDEFRRRKNRWPKKYKRELAAVAENLVTVFESLEGGATIESVRTFGFVHPEPAGVLALDQKGGHGAGLKETRLYLYPEVDAEVLHLITLGDKSSQKADIQFCKEYVQSLNAEQEE